MNADERTILLLAAEALRSCTSEAVSENVSTILAAALERIAGAGQERVTVLEDSEFADADLVAARTAWFEAEERGKP